ncbi:RIP metalloprotease RseP [Bacteroidota bacterium]
MEVLVQIAQLLLSLSILVILHEAGHFVFAKLFNTRVEKFYLFFDPWFSIFKFKKGDTVYGMGWLPLGGYVKISGMIDESMDREQLKKPPQPYEFRSKPAYQRLLIMLGGVLVNFILALFIYASVLYVWGDEYLPTKNVKYGIVCDSLAQSIGLQNGDKIISLDNKHIEDFYDIVPEIVLSETKSIQVERDSSILDIKIPDELIIKLIKKRDRNFRFIEPRIPFSPYIIKNFSKNSPGKEAGLKKNDEIIEFNGTVFSYNDEFRKEVIKQKGKPVNLKVKRDSSILSFNLTLTEDGYIGIIREYTSFFELKTITYGFIEAIPAGINKGFKTIGSYLKQLKLLLKPKTKAYESLGGFITIGSIFPGVWNWQSFWNLTAFLSIILAIMNVLPIPALDGGHVLFLLYEMITGRKPSDKFLEYAQIVGMVILLSLLLYANGNDVARWINSLK